MLQIPFTQYLMPDGTPVSATYECRTQAQEEMVRELLSAGAFFECEVLRTRDVSLTVVVPETETTLAHELSFNDESIINAVDRLITNAYNALRSPTTTH